MLYRTDTRGPQRMKPTDSSDPLTLPLAPPADENFHNASEISKHLLDGLKQNVVQNS